jgi:hypothetical protein
MRGYLISSIDKDLFPLACPGTVSESEFRSVLRRLCMPTSILRCCRKSISPQAFHHLVEVADVIRSHVFARTEDSMSVIDGAVRAMSIFLERREKANWRDVEILPPQCHAPPSSSLPVEREQATDG